MKSLLGAPLHATDGEIGEVVQLFFDDEKWAVRHLVVETGSWLSGRKVLISPASVSGIEFSGGVPLRVDVTLTRAQVKDSPDIDTEHPISRKVEAQYNRYFRIPDYWGGPSTWGMTALPEAFMGNFPMGYAPDEAAPVHSGAGYEGITNYYDENPHLHSTKTVFGYKVDGSDRRAGRVDDLIFDPESWALRYVVVDLKRLWPVGHVLIPIECVKRLDWQSETLLVTATSKIIANSPEFDPNPTLNREFEGRIYGYYNRPGYWVHPSPEHYPEHYNDRSNKSA